MFNFFYLYIFLLRKNSKVNNLNVAVPFYIIKRHPHTIKILYKTEAIIEANFCCVSRVVSFC